MKNGLQSMAAIGNLLTLTKHFGSRVVTESSRFPDVFFATTVSRVTRAREETLSLLFKPNVSKRAAKGDIAGLLTALHYKRDQRVRADAARALGVAVAPYAVPALIEALRDEYDYVRVAAAEALGQIADQNAVTPLIGALEDECGGVRKVAAIALGRVNERQAAPSLIEALSDDDWAVRRAAAEALGELRDTRSVPSLIDTLRDPVYDVRETAAKSLGGLRNERAIEPLKKLLSDNMPPVRTVAALTLKRLCGLNTKRGPIVQYGSIVRQR
jgi:HEAT repeat protein